MIVKAPRWFVDKPLWLECPQLQLSGPALSSRPDYVSGKIVVPSDRHGLVESDINVEGQERTADRRRANDPVTDRVQINRNEAAA